jgi:hypothetical protein
MIDHIDKYDARNYFTIVFYNQLHFENKYESFLQGDEKSVCIIRLNIGKSSKMIFEVSNSGYVISKKSKTQTIVTKFCPSKLFLKASLLF